MKLFARVVLIAASGLFFSCSEKKTEYPTPEGSPPPVKKVWVDADLAIGVQNPNGLYGDVDDGFALMHLLLAKNVEVVGISTVFGNTDLEHAYELGLEIRNAFASSSLGVYKGAAKGIELDSIKTNEAVEALAKRLRKERFTLMAIGPATNIGLLLLLYPELATQIESVVLVAGRRSIDHHFLASERHNPPFPDLNFELDPTAFRILLQHDIKIVLHPFEISHKVWFGKEELARLKNSGEAGAYLSDRSQNWLKQWESWGTQAYNPFDLLASGYLVSEVGFGFEEWPVEIQLAADDRAGNDTLSEKVFKPYLIVGPNVSSKRKVFYYHTAPKSFTEDFLSLFYQ